MSEQLEVQEWGDFSSVIDELEREESTAVVDSDLSAANDEPAAPDKGEAVAGMLSVAFVLTEQATSAISNVDFAFDEKFPTHPNAAQMIEYFQAYAQHFRLTEHIRFNSRVVEGSNSPNIDVLFNSSFRRGK